MKRLVVAVVVVSCLVRAWAMPTRAELTKAQSLVVELMAPAMEAYKTAGAQDKASAAVKVGDTSSEFAKAAETEAAKFLLLKGAVTFYTRGEAYDKAADAVAALQTTVKDVTPAVIAEITGKATSKISETKAPRLFALYRTAKLQIRAASEAKSLALKLKRVKSDAIQRRYAEALAVSGDWKAAYCEFAKLSDAKIKAIVEAEAKGNAKNAASGEFWWAYEPELEDAEDFFKTHAAAFYRQALAVGEITGLKKSIIERRVAEYGAQVDAQLSVDAQVKLFVLPKSGRGPEVKLAIDEKHSIDFASCPAGEFKMGFNSGNSCLKFHEVAISRPFWIAKTPVTYGQVDAMMGKTPRRNAEKGNPNFCLDILGGDNVPAAMSYNQALKVLEMLNRKYGTHLPEGYVFRFASETEYEYAAKSGRSEYNIKRDGVGEITTFEERLQALRDKGYDAVDCAKWPWRVPYFAVGSKKPNAWGIFDMFTAGWAYVLDTVQCKGETDTESLTPFYQDGSVDPVQISVERGSMCVTAGCGWGYFGDAKYQGKGWVKFLMEMGDVFHDDCFLRIVIGPDLVKEQKAGVKTDGLKPSGGAELQTKETKHEAVERTVKGNGQPLVLNLTKDLTMEFVPCPAGEFEMGNSAAKESPAYRHRVKITRPFWIGKYQVSREIWKQFSSDVRLNELKIECGGMKAPMTDMSYSMVEGFCNWLQHRYSGKVKMPKGYVFRLPTEAEWEYALDAGGDLQDDYHRWRDGDDSLCSRIMITKDDYQKIIDKTKVKFPALYHCPALPGGQKKPNAWGVYDMLGNGREFVLDCVSNADYKKGLPTRNLLGTDFLQYEDEEVDPLRYRLEPKQTKGKKVQEGEGRCMLVRNFADMPNGDWYAKGRGGTSWGYGMGATFRVVIGPDLVSEWKAKHGKK